MQLQQLAHLLSFPICTPIPLPACICLQTMIYTYESACASCHGTGSVKPYGHTSGHTRRGQGGRHRASTCMSCHGIGACAHWLCTCLYRTHWVAVSDMACMNSDADMHGQARYGACCITDVLASCPVQSSQEDKSSWCSCFACH